MANVTFGSVTLQVVGTPDEVASLVEQLEESFDHVGPDDDVEEWAEGWVRSSAGVRFA